MIIQIVMIVAFLLSLLCVGFYCRRHATDVNGFVLGGRSVGPWLTAFCIWYLLFFCRYFLWAMPGSLAGISALPPPGLAGNAFIGSLLAWNVLDRRTRVMTQYLEQPHHAGFLRTALPFHLASRCGFYHCFPSFLIPLHCFPLQRSFKPL